MAKRRAKNRKVKRRKLPKLGSGKRFSNLTRKLARKGARSPGALAAYIGRKKFGKKKFGKLGARARRRGR